MQQEIAFDSITAADVAQHLDAIERLRTAVEQYGQHQTALNSIMLTVGRMNGCLPEASISLNASKTGIVVITPDAAPEPEAPSKEVPKSK